jgi:hypothetical protein
MNECFWPGVKNYLDTGVHFGKKFHFWLEGNWTRFYDVLADIPENSTIIWNDSGDDQKALESWGDRNVSVISMPTMVLGNDTAEECVDFVNKILDKFSGYDRKILSFDKDF